MAIFIMAFLYEPVYKLYGHGWMKNGWKMPSIETNFGIFHILSFLHVMDDQVLNEHHLVSDSSCNILQINDAQ